MDAGSMGSVMPLKIAQENSFKIIRPRSKVSLINASGVDMDTQGATIAWVRAKGARAYSRIVFMVSSEIQEILVSFKHQVTLRILPASYPRYLGDKGKEADESTEEEDIAISHSGGSNQETQAIRREPVEVSGNQGDTIHGDNLVERGRAKDTQDRGKELTQSEGLLLLALAATEHATHHD